MPSDPADPRASGDAGRRLVLGQFLPYRLSVLTNHISSAIARTYSERFDLTVPEWRAMAVLGGEIALSAGDVAKRTAMDKVQVSRAVARLVAAKRVQRVADPSDARIARPSLTAKGRAIYDEIATLALELEEHLLGALTPVERTSLDGIIAKLDRQVGLLGGR